MQVTFMGIIKPGDNIEVGGVSGVVQDITWRHTTIEDACGQTIIVPNSNISKNTLVHLMPFAVVLGDDGGDGADAGVGCCKGGAVVTDDKDDLTLNAKVADLAKEHVGFLVKARDG